MYGGPESTQPQHEKAGRTSPSFNFMSFSRNFLLIGVCGGGNIHK
jgi:hypothetical protein